MNIIIFMIINELYHNKHDIDDTVGLFAGNR